MSVTGGSGPTTYDVFISYRHSGLDQKVAELIQNRLERFRTPKALVRRGAPARLSRIFRDTEELATSSDLSESIVQALKASRFLVVVCSPRVKESKWVEKEIEFFRSLGKGNQILALLIDGEPHAAFPKSLFEKRQRSDAIPDELIEPLAADIRAKTPAQARRLLKIEILRILAPILGCSFDDLRQRQQERSRRRWIMAAGTSLVSSLMLASLAGYAIVKRSEALEYADISQRRLAQAQINQSKFLAKASLDTLAQDDVDLALSVALAGLPTNLKNPDRPVVNETISAMMQGLYRDRLLAVLAGHNNYVGYGRFSPDGSLAVTASGDGTARIWDVGTGAEARVLRGHLGGGLNSVEFSPDGARVLTASNDWTARLWDVATGAQLAVLAGHGGPVWRAKFNGDGSRIVTSSFDRTARVWDAASGKALALLVGHTLPVVDATFSLDGTFVVTASQDKTARVWDAATGSQVYVLEGHKLGIELVALSPDGTKVLTGGADECARLWELASGKPLLVLGNCRDVGMFAVKSAAFNPDGTRIVTTSEFKTATVWRADTGAPLVVLQGHENWVDHVTFSPDGSRIATASNDGTSALWDAASGMRLGVLKGHRHVVRMVVFNNDGRRILTASLDQTARLWDADIDRQKFVLRHSTSLGNSALADDVAKIATVSWDHTAHLWNARNGAYVATLNGHDENINAIAFSPDGRWLATGSRDSTVRLWDVDRVQTAAILRGHEKAVSGVAFSNDGSRILSWSEDKTVRVWDVPSGTEIAVLKGHGNFIKYAEFSRDGARIATASMDNLARLWNAATGTELLSLRGHTNFVNSAKFSSDGSRILTASWDRTARLWNAESGEPILTLKGHVDEVTTASFSPDESHILTSSMDGTARIWAVQDGRAVRVLGAGRGLVAADFNPDGTRVVTTATDFTARVWDLASGAELQVVRHRGPIHSAIFSKDGSQLLTSSDDGTARISNAPASTPAALAFGLASARRIHRISPSEASYFFLGENFSGASNSKDGSGDLCDVLAANPFDPQKTSHGVSFALLNADDAIPACQRTANLYPQVARFRYQLARALQKANRTSEAVALYQETATERYPMALWNLGLLFANGLGVGKDTARAQQLYRQAFDAGVVVAGHFLASMLWEQPGGHAEARAIWRRAGDAGDPFSHQTIAWLAELGREGEPPDTRLALIHYSIATRLFEDAGDDVSAAVSRARQSSLARNLSSDLVAEAWAMASAWKQKGRSALNPNGPGL